MMHTFASSSPQGSVIMHVLLGYNATQRRHDLFPRTIFHLFKLIAEKIEHLYSVDIPYFLQHGYLNS